MTITIRLTDDDLLVAIGDYLEKHRGIVVPPNTRVEFKAPLTDETGAMLTPRVHDLLVELT